MSFLNRRDFVVVHTRIEYNKPYLGPGGDGTFKIEPPEYYFFCAGQFQIPAGTPEGTKAAEKANVWKNTMSESTGLLKQEFDLIPE